MVTDQVTLNVGGRLYYTTRGTLEFSEAGFFEALFRRWSSRACDPSTTGTCSIPEVDREPQDEPSLLQQDAKQVPRESEDSSISLDNETCQGTNNSPIFIDRDPDSFEDVLYFMRTRQIKPSTSIDACKVKQLAIEADFLGYQILVQACAACMSKIGELYRPAPTIMAHSFSAIFGNNNGISQPRKEIKLLKDQVLYVDYVSISGLETVPEGERASLSFYRRTSKELAAGQILTGIRSGNSSTENPSVLRIGICISPKLNRDIIGLIAEPPASGVRWQVHFWIGPPDKIPQLGGGCGSGPSQSTPKRPDAVSLLFSENTTS